MIEILCNLRRKDNWLNHKFISIFFLLFTLHKITMLALPNLPLVCHSPIYENAVCWNANPIILGKSRGKSFKVFYVTLNDQGHLMNKINLIEWKCWKLCVKSNEPALRAFINHNVHWCDNAPHTGIIRCICLGYCRTIYSRIWWLHIQFQLLLALVTKTGTG